MLDDAEVEVSSGAPFWHQPKSGAPEWIQPLSRTYIPARVEDNPYLSRTSYRASLQALPEPLRSKMLRGDFLAGKEDNPYQLIPTEWVEAAQRRWVARVDPGPMTVMGVDVARGGRDQTILAPRHGNWFGPLLMFPGADTPNGQHVAALVMANRQPLTRVQIDVIGVGSSAYDHLHDVLGEIVKPLNSAASSEAKDKSGQLGFINLRAEMGWLLREALDPASGQDIALPPDRDLRIDLCADRWKLSARGIQIESKDDIKTRIGRSPDKGDAVKYAHYISSGGWADFVADYLTEKRKAQA
jgi:hypothetical protein